MHNASYLESKVLTAPPQRLQLMLIEGAIRFGRQAVEALRRGDEIAASGPLLRVIDILGELLAGVREHQSDLNRQVADCYWYLFRRVSEAKINTDAAILEEVLRLLEYERQTWQLLCDKLSRESEAAPSAPLTTTARSDRSPVAKPGISFEA